METEVAIAINDVVSIEREGQAALIVINHPPANAISRAVVAGIGRALSQIETDEGCRAIILTGSGERFFAAGADIKEFGAQSGEAIAGGQELTLRLENHRLPIIAAVNGVAFGGGCELALACDLRIASSNARFGQPEINLGIIPGWGGTQRLPRLIGKSRAMELLLTGDPIDAQQALAAGLVTQVVAAPVLRLVALELASRLASRAPLAIAATKRVVHQGLEMSIEEGLGIERDEFIRLFGTDDAHEGVSAFLEKRKPSWLGR